MSARHRFQLRPLWPRNTRDRDWCNVRTHPTPGAWRRHGDRRSASAAIDLRTDAVAYGPSSVPMTRCTIVCAGTKVPAAAARSARASRTPIPRFGGSSIRSSLCAASETWRVLPRAVRSPRDARLSVCTSALNRRTPSRRAAYVNRSSNARPRPRPCQSSATVIATSATSGSSAPGRIAPPPTARRLTDRSRRSPHDRNGRRPRSSQARTRSARSWTRRTDGTATPRSGRRSCRRAAACRQALSGAALPGRRRGARRSDGAIAHPYARRSQLPAPSGTARRA